MTQTTDRLAEVLEVTLADRTLFKSVITGMAGPSRHNAIDNGGFDEDDRMQFIARHRLAATQSLSTGLDKAQQRIAELEAALAASKQGWDNVLEFRLIADNHRTTARALSDEAFAALNQSKESGNEG